MDCLSLGRGSRELPVVGKQFTEPGDRVRGDAREHITEPGKRFDAAPLAGSDEASQHRCRVAAAVAAKEGPVATAQRDIAVGPFRGAVVNLQLAVFQKARQRLPLIQRIAHRSAGWTLWQNLRLQLQQILVELSGQPRRYPLAQCQPLLR